jgi:ubiquinone/menaquinone biosynthesis C-methylase UbiE
MEVVTNYEPYSQEPEYIGANKALMETFDLRSVRRVIDLACGTGLLSDLLLQMKPDLVINGVDISNESLEIGRRLFREKGLLAETDAELEAAFNAGRGAIRLEERSAMDPPFPDGRFEAGMIGNAIHLMPDKDLFLKGVQRMLKPKGQFAFNSVFFTGTFAEGTEPVYTEWMKEALLLLTKKNEERAKRGEPPIKRVRGKFGRAFDKDWKTPEEWSAMLEKHGFRVTRVYKRPIPITQRALELVGAYGGLAEVLMTGYPVDVASECLQHAVKPAFERSGVTEVIRYWLEITATRL